MATDDPLARILARVEPSDDVPERIQPGDTSRMSIEAFVAASMGTARELASEGSLRLHGAGVVGTTAELADVGLIASTWQKLVSAVGGALEDIRSLRGQLPADIVTRTTLVLAASPSPGSVILHLRPKADPFVEVAPNGLMPMVEPDRPLADRASEALIELLSHAAAAGPDALDDLSEQMKAMGPRVGSSLTTFASSLVRSDITLGASWREPDHATRRAEVTPSTAKWLRDFVLGRDLDADVVEMVGVLRTISDAQNWRVDVDDKPVRMDASELAPDAISQFHVGQRVRLTVRIAMREQPDGRTFATHTILDARAADE